MAKPFVVMRETREVKRVWPPADAFLYNLMTINVVIGFTLPFLSAVLYYGGGSWTLATLLSAAFCSAEAVVYAFFASSLPRSGGEYYFQSRVFSAAAGSIFAFAAFILGGTMWMAITGWYAARLAVGPLLAVSADLLSAPSLMVASEWCQSSWGILALSVLVTGWCALVNVAGLSVYARLQRAFWRVGALALAAIVGALLVAQDATSGDVFTLAYARAVDLGFDPSAPRASPLAAFQVVPLASFTLVYLGWHVQQSGETRRATSLKTQLWVILGSMWLTAAMSIGLGALVNARFEASRLAAGAYLFLFHPESLPVPTVPFFWFSQDAGLRTGLVAVTLALLFNAMFWMYAPNATLAASRVLLAMSSDHVLPRWVGRIHPGTRAPVNAVLLFSLLSVVPAGFYAFTDYWRLTLNTLAMTNLIAFTATCAAGAVFPFVRRELYRESTAAPHELLGIPLITWSGGAFLGFSGFLLWRFVVDPGLSLGMGLHTPALVTLGVYVLSAVLYYSFRAYRRSHEGAEIEISFTEAGSVTRQPD